MPKKLDDCVKKVMAKGNTQGTSFAICKKSLGLTKVAISLGLAKKVLNKRIVLKNIVQDAMEDIGGGLAVSTKAPYSGAKSRIANSTYDYLLPKEKQAYDKLESLYRKIGQKESKDMSHIERIRRWGDNKKLYGKVNPTIIDKAKRMFSLHFGHNDNVQNTKKRLAPAYAMG